MPENGRMTPTELSPIPGGQLANEAARAWNSPGGPADHRLRPGGPASSYRTYAQQVQLRAEWCAKGACQNAAVPGESLHGEGVCVDCPNLWEQLWLRVKGAKFGWRKIEASWEPWHWNYTGGGHIVLRLGHRGKWVRKYRSRLRFLGYKVDRFGRFDLLVKGNVETFQKRHGLPVTGEIDGTTAYRINHAVYRRGK